MFTYKYPYDFRYDTGKKLPINVNFSDNDILSAVKQARNNIENAPKVINYTVEELCLNIQMEAEASSGIMNARIVFSQHSELSISIILDYPLSENEIIRIASIRYSSGRCVWKVVYRHI